MRQPRFAIRYVGGPFNGRQRQIQDSPHRLASPVAVPVDQALPQQLAVYRLRNDNGEWSYCHVHTASADELGVDSPRSERQWQEEWTPVA
jgi:hypothetical protein